jgi:hypothetical protein
MAIVDAEIMGKVVICSSSSGVDQSRWRGSAATLHGSTTSPSIRVSGTILGYTGARGSSPTWSGSFGWTGFH